jgi:hypothetical protein
MIQRQFRPKICTLPSFPSHCKLLIYSGSKQRHAFLDQMIQAVKKGAILSDQELQSEVDTVMLAVS